MNRIVRHNCPVEKLPEDLREGLEGSRVTITVEDVAAAAEVQSARLRSDRSMRQPDAVHVATALATGCRLFLSRDRRIRALPDGLERREVQPETIDLIGRILDTA